MKTSIKVELVKKELILNINIFTKKRKKKKRSGKNFLLLGEIIILNLSQSKNKLSYRCTFLFIVPDHMVYFYIFLF